MWWLGLFLTCNGAGLTEWLHLEGSLARLAMAPALENGYTYSLMAPASLVICSIAVCNTWSSGGTALCRVVGCNQSIGSTVSDAIVSSWLWLTATRGSPLGYFSKLLQVVDN